MFSSRSHFFLLLFLADSVRPERLLTLSSLSEYPLATCNDGSPAVYYREAEAEGVERPGKYLIYLRGGGMCLPFVPGLDCEARCEASPHLCSAPAQPTLDLAICPLADNVASQDPEVNPAFYDFRQGWLLTSLMFS